MASPVGLAAAYSPGRRASTGGGAARRMGWVELLSRRREDRAGEWGTKEFGGAPEPDLLRGRDAGDDRVIQRGTHPLRPLPVGGIREKLIAARRNQVLELILPEANRPDYDELPDHLKEGLTVHFAADYPRVAAIAFASPVPGAA